MNNSTATNRYIELSQQNINMTHQDSQFIIESDRRLNENENFWIKNDFLNLKFFVKFNILKSYYTLFYITLGLFFLIMIALFFPVDWSDNTDINALMGKIDVWIKAKDVSLSETARNHPVLVDSRLRVRRIERHVVLL